jgi:hypothetical protein
MGLLDHLIGNAIGSMLSGTKRKTARLCLGPSWRRDPGPGGNP